MCLGIPGQIVSIDGLSAVVEFWGVRRTVRLDVIDDAVKPGDYVLNHVGFAIRRIPADAVEETLALYDELLAHVTQADPMADEVRDEQEALPLTQRSEGDDG